MDLGLLARRPAQHEDAEVSVGVNQIPRVGSGLVPEGEALHLGGKKVQGIQQLLDLDSPQLKVTGALYEDSIHGGDERGEGLHHDTKIVGSLSNALSN